MVDKRKFMCSSNPDRISGRHTIKVYRMKLELIQQLAGKKAKPGEYLQQENKRKDKAFVREIENNQDVMGVVKEICKVETKAIEKKLQKAVKAEEIELLFTATDPDFAPLLKNYCNKTGRFLHSVDIQQLKKIVNVLGRERALEILRLQAVQHVSLEWLHTEPDTLNSLMINDCKGYFVYCAGSMFHTDYTVISAAGTTAPNVSNKNLDEIDSLLNGLPDFNITNPVGDMTFHCLPVKDKTRYLNLQDKLLARENLGLLDNKVLVMQANELMRRLLGLASSANIAKMGVFQSVTLKEITESVFSLTAFIAELQAALKTVFIQFFKGMHYTKAEFIIKRLQTRTITAANIAAIKAEFKGKSNFHKQPKIRNLSDRQKQEQAILHDLMNFWDTQPELGSSVDAAMTKTDSLLGCVFDAEDVKPKPVNPKMKNREGNPQLAKQFQSNDFAKQIEKQIKQAAKPKSYTHTGIGFKLKL